MPTKTQKQPAPWLTISELNRQLKVLKVPSDASIKLAGTSGQFKFLSFNRETKEVSLH